MHREADGAFLNRFLSLIVLLLNCLAKRGLALIEESNRRKLLLQTVSDPVRAPASSSTAELACPICLELLFRRVTGKAAQEDDFSSHATDFNKADHKQSPADVPGADLTEQVQQSNVNRDEVDENGHVASEQSLRLSSDSPGHYLPTEEVLSLRICSHVFHARCIAEWMAQPRRDCPVCRVTFWEQADFDTTVGQALGGSGAQTPRRPSVSTEQMQRGAGGSGAPNMADTFPAGPQPAQHHHHHYHYYPAVAHVSPAHAAAWAAAIV